MRLTHWSTSSLGLSERVSLHRKCITCNLVTVLSVAEERIGRASVVTTAYFREEPLWIANT
jgi:hypothetical protein